MGTHPQYALLTYLLVYTGRTGDSIFRAVFDIGKNGYYSALLCTWIRLKVVAIL
jgi:hypothetical protein